MELRTLCKSSESTIVKLTKTSLTVERIRYVSDIGKCLAEIIASESRILELVSIEQN